MDRIFIEVVDRLTGQSFSRVVSLPAQIGKQPNAGNAILLDARYPTISRVHGVIERQNGQLVYRDQSSNGSRVDGHRVHRGARLLGAEAQIAIENYDLALTLERSLLVLQTSATLAPIGQLTVRRGEAVEISRTVDGLVLDKLEIEPPTQPSALAADASMPQADDAEQPQPAPELASVKPDRQPVLRLTYEHDGIACACHGDPTLVLVNGLPLGLAASIIQFHDVIRIGDTRFELHAPGEGRIVCGNPACRLLNPLQFEQNCKWCGFHLAGGGAISRDMRG